MFALKAPSPTFLSTLQTVARVATENWKLQVKWNDSKQSFTDCCTEIQIGWNTDWILEGCSNLAEWTAAMKGLLEHEIAHNLFSRYYEVRDSEVVPLLIMETYLEKLKEEGMPKKISKFIENALEDGRVNRLHVNLSPKMIQALRWVNELNYQDACRMIKETKVPLAWALNSFLQRTRCGKDIENVPEETVRFLDSIQGYIEEGLHAKSTSEMIDRAAMPIAIAFTDEFPDMFVPAHMLWDLEYGKHRPMEELESRISVPEQGIDVRYKVKPRPKHADDKSEARVEIEEGERNALPEDSEVKSDEPKEESNAPEEEVTPEREELGLREYDDDSSPREADDDYPKDIEGGKSPDVIESGLPELDLPKEEETDFSDMFSKSAAEAIEFSAKDEALEREVRLAREELSKFVINDTRKYSLGIHEKVVFKEIQAPDNVHWAVMYEKDRREVQALIDESVDRLREYLVHQKRSGQRNLRNGRIDPRRLWRAAGLLDGRIFMERAMMSNKTDVAFYILLDMSGSMCELGRIEKTRKAAVILVEMLEFFGVAHTVVAYTADSTGYKTVEHYRLVNWGEKEKSRLMFYHDDYNNRDGYSLRIAIEELSKRPEKAKILLMLSDGLPEAEGYIATRYALDPKDQALNDVAAAVDESLDKKVEVIHLYFGNTEKATLEKVAFMYPKFSAITNAEDVPGAVADVVVTTLRKYM